MNNNPHLLAIVESKVAQVRTNLEHNKSLKARSLLSEIQIYTDDLHCDIISGDRIRQDRAGSRPPPNSHRA